MHQLVLGSDTDLDVLLIDEAIPTRQIPRLGLAMTASIRLPSAASGPRGNFLRQLGAPVLESGQALRRLVNISENASEATADAPSFRAPTPDGITTRV